VEHLEGRQSVLAALSARQRQVQSVLIRRDAHAEKFDDLLALAEAANVPIRFVEKGELDALAHGRSHGGVIALVSPKPRLDGAGLLRLLDTLREPALFLLLEGIEDARNLGFVLRSAEALGAHAVIIKKHVWDLDATEIARPASGAYERLPLAQLEDVSALIGLQQRGVQLLGCLAGVRQTLFEAQLARPIILAVGGEKRGLSGAVRAICDGFITIPTTGDAGSLSLSHAAAILLAEAMRQRTFS
jgi:23S rRNA (guanosine2251-2'-O)-methyltransferase